MQPAMPVEILIRADDGTSGVVVIRWSAVSHLTRGEKYISRDSDAPPAQGTIVHFIGGGGHFVLAPIEQVVQSVLDQQAQLAVEQESKSLIAAQARDMMPGPYTPIR